MMLSSLLLLGLKNCTLPFVALYLLSASLELRLQSMVFFDNFSLRNVDELSDRYELVDHHLQILLYLAVFFKKVISSISDEFCDLFIVF